MQRMGLKLMIFASAFALYAWGTGESRLLTGAGIFGAVGLLLFTFAKK